jgi:hypothetical protein
MMSVGNAVFMPRTDKIAVYTAAHPVCDLCGSKIYPGDTIFSLDRQVFCEDCVEVSEYETGIGV